MNTKADATDELLSEAKKAIEIILSGKEPAVNYGATTGFLQYISDWIMDNSDDLKPEQKQKLEDYCERHVPIAIRNKEQQMFNEQLLAGTTGLPGIGPEIPPPPVPGNVPPGTPPQVPASPTGAPII